MSSTDAVNVARAQPRREVGGRRSTTSTPIPKSVHASRRRPRPRRAAGSPSAGTLSSSSLYGALPPGAVQTPLLRFQPAASSRLRGGLRVERHGAAAPASYAHDDGGTRRVGADRRRPPSAPAHQRVAVDRPEERLADPYVAQLRMARPQVEQDRRQGRRRVPHGARRPAVARGGGDGSGSRPATPSMSPSRRPRRPRVVIGVEVDARCARWTASGPPGSRVGLGVDERVEASGVGARPSAVSSGPAISAVGVSTAMRLVELGERVTARADGRLREVARGEVGERHVREQVRRQQRLRRRPRGSPRSASSTLNCDRLRVDRRRRRPRPRRAAIAPAASGLLSASTVYTTSSAVTGRAVLPGRVVADA